MAGPTPVSALIHAATMVTAGVYMMVRTGALWHVAVPGQRSGRLDRALTGAAGRHHRPAPERPQEDPGLLHRVAAWLHGDGRGLGAYGAAMFHLTTHAFFKALLFLGAGSVMHATDGILDINRLGGLRTKMPATYRTFLVGTAALAGIIPLLRLLLQGCHPGGGPGQQRGHLHRRRGDCAADRLLQLPRLFVTFHGEPRDAHIFAHVHESPRIMTSPLWILAFLADGRRGDQPAFRAHAGQYWLEPPSARTKRPAWPSNCSASCSASSSASLAC
jgi:NADH-quinone oxidoreductase subunit L